MLAWYFPWYYKIVEDDTLKWCRLIDGKDNDKTYRLNTRGRLGIYGICDWFKISYYSYKRVWGFHEYPTTLPKFVRTEVELREQCR